MADERVHSAVKIVDPTTTSQQLGIDASGHAQVDIAASSATVTVDNGGTFAVQEDGAALTALQLLDNVVAVLGTATYTEATTSGAVIGAVRNDTLAALANTDNEIAPLQVNASGALYIQEGSALDVSGATVTVTATNLDVQSGGTDLATSAQGAAIQTAVEIIDNAVHVDDAAYTLGTDSGIMMMGFAGTQSVNANDAAALACDTDGHLQVDVLTGGGVDSPTNATVNLASTSGTAAGATADLDSAEITEAEKLWGVDVTASVPFKGIIRMVENSIDSNLAVVFGRAGEVVQWRVPHRDFAAHAGASGGTDVFQVEATNMDTSEAADLYATFYYST